MRPFLAPGDGVAVEWEKGGGGWRGGDIVLARDPGGAWIVHRVVAQAGEAYVAKGDAALALDRLQADEIWGRVVAVRRASDGAEAAFGRSRVDSWIAALSFAAAAPGESDPGAGRWLRRVWAAAARRAARALGVARREILWTTARRR